MCGIVGRYNINKKVEKHNIEEMLNSIIHRGPDDSGIWVENNIGLGHRLLKIQDLSEKSVQPYKYQNLVMAFNGEIYNYEELKKELKIKGIQFNTVGDTEVLIKCFYEWGIEKTLNKIEGCFAIALYDKEKEKLYLIRDRLGVKPFHYYRDKDCILFGSEIKAILKNKEVRREYNKENVIVSLACRLWMHPKWTMFKDIYNIEPGSYIEISKDSFEQKQYYEINYEKEILDENEAIERFGKEFKDSINKKLISKVPIAAFLSGGIDSSLLCKTAQDNLEEQLNTYTICYENDNDLDLIHAEELAQKENFKQNNILITEDYYTIENIDKVIHSVEEILIDKVYLPVYFNYKAAKDDGFTVVLNGQGSDEVWLGYIFNWNIFNYTKETDSIEKLINEYYMPNIIFKDKFSVEFKDKIKDTLREYLADTLTKYSKANDNDKLNEYSIMSIKTILHDLLLQEDKLAMAHSVESRVPFVDNHRLVELSMKIPGKLKIKDGREKYILRQYGKDLLPESIIKRRKYAFPEPPNVYDKKIRKICEEHWNDITKSAIVNEMIDKQYLKGAEMSTDRELWWILVYWRFENIFKMEV